MEPTPGVIGPSSLLEIYASDQPSCAVSRTCIEPKWNDEHVRRTRMPPLLSRRLSIAAYIATDSQMFSESNITREIWPRVL